jgi:hypothetical protein
MLDVIRDEAEHTDNNKNRRKDSRNQGLIQPTSQSWENYHDATVRARASDSCLAGWLNWIKRVEGQARADCDSPMNRP